MSMMPLRAAIPRIVRNPTSEPSEMTPSPKYAASTPPTRAEGKVKKEKVARRPFPKDTCRVRTITPIGESVGAALEVFMLYDVRRGCDTNVGYVLQLHITATRCVDQKLANI